MSGVGGHARGVLGRCAIERPAFTSAGLDDTLGRPSHAEVGLDGAGVPQRADDLALDAGVLALRGDHRVHVGRRTADVDHQDVSPDHLGEHLDAAQHGIRRRCLDELGETATTGQALAADDVGEEGLADGGARRLRRHDPDARQHVVCHDEPPPRRGEQRRDLVRGIRVARDDDRRRESGLGQPLRVVQQHPGVASVGAADEEDEIGGCRPQRLDVVARHRAAGDVDDLGTRGEPDPLPGLGGHLPLVPHDGQPQAAPRAGAGEHLGGLAGPRQVGTYGIHPVHDVGADGGRVAGGAEDGTRRGVDEHRLGEGRPDVDAQDARAGGGHSGLR